MKREYIVLFIILSILSFPNLVNLCRSFNLLTYDYQILLAWDYSASTGLLPFKDISYPGYGLLIYYKGQNVIFSLLYYFLTPILLTSLYFILNKVYENRLYSYLSISFLYLFILNVTGFEIFSRYGTTVVTICFFAYLFFYKHLRRKKILFTTGIINGIILPLLNDQGIYMLISFYLLLITDRILADGLMREIGWYFKILIDSITYLAGFLLGMTPFLIYFASNGSIYPFFYSFKEIMDISIFAKTPFFHSFGSKDNLFIFFVLFLSISYLSYYLIYKKSKRTLNIYLLVSLIFVLMIFEQKNILRSIDVTFTFISFILLLFIFHELRINLRNCKIPDLKIFIYFINILIIIIFITGFRTNDQIKNIVFCQSDKKFEINDKKFTDVKAVVEKLQGFDGKIFSFPGDTAFYVLFRQKMPYFPTSFEASSIEGQNKLIQYIKENKINYIIYNFKDRAIQDEVPNLARSPILHSYILNNFTLNTRAGDYIIMQRNTIDRDFFTNTKLNKIPDFKKYLIQIDLANIPRSEGIYKSKYLSDNKLKIVKSSSSLNEINNYLAGNKIDSSYKFVVIKFKNPTNKQKSILHIDTKNKLSTDIQFNTCGEKNVCIINLSHIPIFYKQRILNSISIDYNSKIENISLIELKNKYVQ